MNLAQIPQVDERLFPLTLEKALQLCIPKRKPEDRMHIYRELLKVKIHFDGFNPPKPASDTEVAELLAMKHKREFNREQFESMAMSLLSWLPFYQEHLRQERAQKAGKARWDKKVEKKPLTHSKGRNTGASITKTRRKHPTTKRKYSNSPRKHPKSPHKHP